MRAINVVKKFFAIVFVIVFSLVTLLVVLSMTIRVLLSKDAISFYIKNSDVFYVASSEVGNGKCLRDVIGSDLLEIGIPVDVTDNVLESEKFNQIMIDYAHDYLNYLLLNGDEVTIPKENLVSLISDEYYLSQGAYLPYNSSILLNDYVNNFSSNIDKYIFHVDDLNGQGIYSFFRVVASLTFFDYLYIGLFSILVLIYILIIFCLNSGIKTYKWCCFSFIFSGIILALFSFLEVKFLNMIINNNGIIDSLVITIANYTFENLLFYGIALILLGIVLLAICALLLKKEAKQKSDFLLEEVIKKEIIDSCNREFDDGITSVSLDKDLFKPSTDIVDIEVKGEIPDVKISGSDFVFNDTDDIKIDDYFILKDDCKNINSSATLAKEEEIEVCDDNIYKNDINVFRVNEVELEVVTPVKGRDIVFTSLDDAKEEEIEIL